MRKLGKDVAIGAHSVIGENAVLADRVVIGPLCDVGRDVTIGEDSHLVSGVTLYPGTILGARVRLHAGVRVGSDGFGYVPTKTGVQKIPHVGRAILEDDVEVGANSTIDRGSIADTVIGAGTKLDNLVMIAHNVRLGRMCLIAAQSGIAGSTRLGDGCMIGGQVGVTGHLELGNNVKLGAGSGVMDDIPDGRNVERRARAAAARMAESDIGVLQAGGPAARDRATDSRAGHVTARRHSIGGPVSLHGIGLHLGRECTLTFHPAPSKSGIVFRRIDLPGTPTVHRARGARGAHGAPHAARPRRRGGAHGRARARRRSPDSRSTTFASISTRAEPPILDGSARPFHDALLSAGIVDVEGEVEYLTLCAPLTVQGWELDVHRTPSQTLSLDVTIDFPHPLIGRQSCQVPVSPASFASELAAARTFGFLREADALRAKGLIQGVSTANTVVLDDNGTRRHGAALERRVRATQGDGLHRRSGARRQARAREGSSPIGRATGER